MEAARGPGKPLEQIFVIRDADTALEVLSQSQTIRSGLGYYEPALNIRREMKNRRNEVLILHSIGIA